MAVDKRIPRILNSDADSKIINKVSMLDALNLYSGPDNEGFSGGVKNDSGDGVLKNIRGNEEVSVHLGEELPGDCRVLGSVEDIKNSITYFFVYSNDANNQGIWAYDKNDILNTASGGEAQGPFIRLIYKSAQFNFPQNGFVKADVVYTSASKTLDDLGDDFDKDVLIYFTDGVNEPRKLNAYRAFSEFSGSQAYPNNIYAESDFICACPRVPLEPITFQFDFDPDRSVSNFSRSGGFKFAYQYIYKDGIESAISPYSDVAFPPSVLNQGSQTYIDHSQFNRCILSIPSENIEEVKEIRILAKEGAAGNFVIIDEIDDFTVSDTQTYNFYNDRISRGVSTDEVNKQFDSVPRNAVSQAAISNRMTYGNYLDGFDNVKTEAVVEAVYRERGEDFKTFNIKVEPSIELLDLPGDENKKNAKTVGFVLDCSDLPTEISEGTIIDFKLTIAPDKNWHLYEFKDDKSYHQSRHLGPQQQQGETTLFNNANFETSFHQSEEDAGTNYLGENGGNVFGVDTQINDILSWKFDPPINTGSNFPGYFNTGNITAAIGTSAGNPVIFQGGTLVFKAKIRCIYNIGFQGSSAAINVATALEACLTNPDLNFLNSFLASVGFTLDGYDPQSETAIQDFEQLGGFDNQPSYSFDLNIQDGDIIDQPYAETEGESNDYRSKLICSIKQKSTINQSVVPVNERVPVGHFIVNKATLQFYCKKALQGDTDSLTRKHIKIGLLNVSGIGGDPIDLVTCVHEIPTFEEGSGQTLIEDQVSSGWIAIKKESVQSIIAGGASSESGLPASWDEFTSQYGLGPLNINDNNGSNIAIADPNGVDVSKNFLLQLGWLDNVSSTELNFFDNPYNPALDSDTPPIKYCLMDGEGGPGGGPSRGSGDNPYDNNLNYLQGSVSVQPHPSSFQGFFQYAFTTFYAGSLVTDINNAVTPMPLLFIESPEGVEIVASYPAPSESTTFPGFIGLDDVNYNLLHSHAEIKNVSVVIGEGLYEFDRSFKSEANHDFGIIYYDERGRHGFVNHLDTVFIDGYSTIERGTDLHGPAHVRIKLYHEPPSWAHSYKIAYSGNTTVSDFVQYSAGGAFAKNSGQEISEENSNIFVSLNYLQGHPISYVSSFGARTPEGGLNLYKFSPGDKLRVISYGPATSRQYPYDYEFEVVDLVKLGNSANPLFDSAEAVPENAQGDFVILKDNPNAFGFTYGDVYAQSDLWGNNCIIELRTPQKDRDVDELIYYEIGDTYKILFDNDPQSETFQQLIHQGDSTDAEGTPIVEINKGDVWFRPVAVNVREEVGGFFEDIISDLTGGTSDVLSESNFVSVLLETESANDLFRSDNSFIGRPNVIFEDSAETKREATITYSDRTNPEGNKVNYSSFNSSLANFKDLSERYGGIFYMSDHGEYILVIQRDKTSIVPVDKNILSSASGTQQIIASTEVLNEAVVYPGDSGCDTDPSSVYDSGDKVYFCNKATSKVYRWTRSGGAEEISAKGLSSFIRAAISRAIDAGQVRAVGGFDPLKEEYLLSIQNLQEYDTPFNVQFVDQPPKDPSVAPGYISEATIAFTQAYNDFYEDQDPISPEDMSKELAVDYLKDLKNDPDVTNQPTFNDLFGLLSEADSTVATKFAYDAGNAIGGEVDATLDGNVGTSELLSFLSVYSSANYDPSESIFNPQPSIVANPPPVSPLINFVNVQDAVSYILSRGDLTVEEFYVLSSQIRDEFVLNIDEFAGIALPELLALLSNFQDTLEPDESAFTNNPPIPGGEPIPAGPSSLDAILWIVNDGTMTVGEYFELAQYIKTDAKLDVNQDYAITAADLLIFLSFFGFATAGGFGSYSANTLAFQQ